MVWRSIVRDISAESRPRGDTRETFPEHVPPSLSLFLLGHRATRSRNARVKREDSNAAKRPTCAHTLRADRALSKRANKRAAQTKHFSRTLEPFGPSRRHGGDVE